MARKVDMPRKVSEGQLTIQKLLPVQSKTSGDRSSSVPEKDGPGHYCPRLEPSVNWQRSGAVVNATLNEFKGAKVTREGKVTLFIRSVLNHKTAMEGVTKVILEPLDQARVVQYVETVRQAQDITGKSPTLFLLTGGRTITNQSSKIKKLVDRYGLSLPSVSRVRKIGLRVWQRIPILSPPLG